MQQERLRKSLAKDGYTMSMYSIVEYLDKVCPNLHQKMVCNPENEMLDIDVNALMWRMFMSATIDAAVHLGGDHEENLRSTRNANDKTMWQLFGATQTQVLQQDEFGGMSTIIWTTRAWRRSTSLYSRAIELSTSKAYVFSDSVFCLGKIPSQSIRCGHLDALERKHDRHRSSHLQTFQPRLSWRGSAV